MNIKVSWALPRCPRNSTVSQKEILAFSLKKGIYNYFVKLIDSIQIPWLDPSQPLTKYLDSNRGLCLERTDETLIF
jgi:hypothetical protein